MATVTLASLEALRSELVHSKYYLNIRSGYMAPVTLHCSYGDSGESVTFYLFDGVNSLDLTGCTASIHGTRHDGANFGPFICSVSGNEVTFTLQSSMTAVEGGAIAEITITKSNTTIGTCNFGILVENATFPNGVSYDTDPSVYMDILKYVQSFSSDLTAARIAGDNENAAAIAVQKARIDNYIASGTAATNSELIDIRVGADGKTYTSAGEAVRTQVGNITEEETLSHHGLNTGAAFGDGTFGTGTDYKYLYRSLENVTMLSVKTSWWLTRYPAIAFYDANGAVVSTVPAVTGEHDYGNITIPENAVVYSVNTTANMLSKFVVVERHIGKHLEAKVDISEKINVGVAISDGTFGTRIDTRYVYDDCYGASTMTISTTYWESGKLATLVFYDSTGKVISIANLSTGGAHTFDAVVPVNATNYAVNCMAVNVDTLSVIKRYDVYRSIAHLSQMVGTVSNKIEPSLVLPKKMYGVVGYPSYLYYENVLKNAYLKDYTISSGYLQTRRECQVIVPTTAGTSDINVILYNGANQIKTAKVSLVTSSTTVSGTAKVLIIGDSKSEARWTWDHLSSLISADNKMNLTFLGTNQCGVYKTEAYSGRNLVNVCDDQYITGTTPNIFYDSTVTTTNNHHFSFSKGVSTLGATPDIVIIDHGANNAGIEWNIVKGCYDDMITSIKSVKSTMKIVIVVQEQPALLDNTMHITDGKWSLYNEYCACAEKVIREYDGRESENIYLQPQYLSLDLYHDYPICSLPTTKYTTGERDFCMDRIHPGLNTSVWSSSTTYNYGDWVNRNNKGYGCRKACKNVDPETDDGTYWAECKNLNDGYAKKACVYFYILKYLLSL